MDNEHVQAGANNKRGLSIFSHLLGSIITFYFIETDTKKKEYDKVNNTIYFHRNFFRSPGFISYTLAYCKLLNVLISIGNFIQF